MRWSWALTSGRPHQGGGGGCSHPVTEKRASVPSQRLARTPALTGGVCPLLIPLPVIESARPTESRTQLGAKGQMLKMVIEFCCFPGKKGIRSLARLHVVFRLFGRSGGTRGRQH